MLIFPSIMHTPKADVLPLIKDDNKRTRKKKIFEGFEQCDDQTGGQSSQEAINSVSSKWLTQPKLWCRYGVGEWTAEKAKLCNKSKGCLHNCGKNNSTSMVRCD